MMATLVVIGGLPGTGKSTLGYRLARERGWALLSKDQINRSMVQVDVVDFWVGYEVMFGLARLNLRNGVSVVLDAVFRLERLRAQAARVAEECAAAFASVECSCSDGDTWQERVASRPAMVDGWTPVDWEGIQRIQKRYAAWQPPFLALDATDPLETNYRRLIEHLDGER